MFQRKFPFINFGRTWGMLTRSQEPRQSRKVELRIVCDGKGEAPFYYSTTTNNLNPASFPYEEVSLGRITISEKTNWSELETLISQSFKRFLERSYSYKELELSEESIYAWEIPTQIILEFRSNRDRPEIKPIVCLKDDYESRVLVYLKGATQMGAIDAMAFQLQLPKSTLERHIEGLETRGRVVLCGPRFVHSRIEMGFVAKKLAEYMLIKDRHAIEPHYLATFNVHDPDGDRNLGLAAFMDGIKERCNKKRSNQQGAIPPPHVVLLENLQSTTQDVDEIVAMFNEFRGYCTEVHYIIGTFVRPCKAER